MSTSPVADVEVGLDFYAALKEVASGKKITRPGWPEHACIFLHASAVHVRDTRGLHTLILTDADLQATDWQVVREH